MIKSFADKRTESIFKREFVKGISGEICRMGYRRLLFLDETDSLQDLQAISGNRLEKLKGDRRGQFSMRINEQWRICFRWQEGDAHDVEVVDYH
ncbi:type II toxin-antitoxin system RelE/ParE family toxin [Candidatus Acetothermia bacterium]|nr:type II toxin-antitoxin system RelE/ParE family toxin [Candidatus Acetothermia bacterium]